MTLTLVGMSFHALQDFIRIPRLAPGAGEQLALRWIHIVAGIMWIGDSFLFMWLDRTLVPPDPPREGVTGELFMLHGGGYYQVEKLSLIHI